MILRDLRRLADTTFDLLVVGSGIYGALAAWEAAARGLTVALIDRADYGGGTSFNSLKTLHGGLRSLQSLNGRQMRLFIRERRAMARMAPHLVQPLPFCVPTYRHPVRNAMAMRVALAISDAVAVDRHTGLADPALHLPRGRVVSRDECLALNPIIDGAGVTGGAVWFDYQIRQSERLLVSAVRSAVAAGAVTANYVAARSLLRDGTRVTGVTVDDAEGGSRFDVRARAVLNAAGPWAGELLTTLCGGAVAAPAARLSRAMNLVVDRVTGTHACGGVVDGRFLFVVPWRDVSIVGTSHDPHDGGADLPHGTPAHVEQLLGAARVAFPGARLTTASVRLVHRGLLPMVSAVTAPVALLKESAVVNPAVSGHPGLLSIFSVRYTTAGDTAAAAVDAVMRQLDRAPGPRVTGTARMSGAPQASMGALLDEARRADAPGTTTELRSRLAQAYGTAHGEVTALIAATPDLATPMDATCAVTRAELLHAVRVESARTLSDALLRRTEAGSAGYPGDVAVGTAARVLAVELGWTATRIDAEITAVRAAYPAT